MTVIHIIAGIDYFGGAEQMVFKLSNKCKEHNIKPIVVSITNYGNDNEFFFNLNIEHYFLDSWGFKDFGKAMKQIKEIIKKNDDVVIHSHMFHAGILASFYTLFYKKVPIVFTMHTNKVRVFYRRVLLFLTKPFRKFDIIFSHNSNKWYLKNNAIIANGIDFSRFKIGKKRVYEPKSQFKFLFIGRITEPKNPLFMVDLVKKLKQHNYNFKINIVGDGELRESFEQKIKAENVQDYFTLHGSQKDITPYLNEAHCLILPSLWEGMPVTIIEAAAANMPIIATPVGSIPDFLNNNNAYVSNLNEFHLAMMKAIDNYDEAIKKSEILFKEVESIFDIKSVFKQHLDCYTKALESSNQ